MNAADKARRAERKKTSTARAMAEKSGGFTSNTVSRPGTLEFFEAKPGVVEMDIVPFLAGKGNPNAEAGELHFERTFYVYKDIGGGEVKKSWYCCPKATFGQPDPIAEWMNQAGPDVDQALKDSLKPKKRQLFLVWLIEEQKLKLWDVSYYLFGEKLDSRIKNAKDSLDWDLFYFADQDGLTLSVTIETGKGGRFNEATAIDFLPRENPIPDGIVNHGHCLDEFLVSTPYNKLKSAFLGMGDDGDDQPAMEKTTAPEETKSVEPEPEPEKAASYPVAGDYGIKKGDDVHYNGRKCQVMKISKDGTSLLLSDDETDDMTPGVGPDEVVTGDVPTEEKKQTVDKADFDVFDEPKALEPQQRDGTEKEPAVAAIASGGDDDPWAFPK